MMHKNKSDFLRIQEQLKQEINILNKEKDSLEQRLRQVLEESEDYLHEIQVLKEQQGKQQDQEYKKLQQ